MRRPGLPLACALLAIAQLTVTSAPLTAQRVEPGAFPGWFVRGVNASPQLEDLPSPPPRWLPHDNNAAARTYYHARAALTPALRAAWDSQALAVIAFIRRAPVFSRPLDRDFETRSSTSLVREEYRGAGGERTAILMGGFTIGAFSKKEIITLPNGTLRTDRGAHTAHFMVTFNDLPVPAAETWTEDTSGKFFVDRPEGFVDGMPIYGSSLLLTRNNRSPWMSVSMRRALKAFIASPYVSDTSKASARSMLEELSDSELAAPAWVCGNVSLSTQHCLRPPNSPGAAPLKAVDPTFFDQRLPRHAIQVMTIDGFNYFTKGSNPEEKNGPFAINLAIFQQTDWKALRDQFVK